jgi:DNA-binding MarR family transcriptional regulator
MTCQGMRYDGVMTEWLNDKQQRTWREFLQVKSRLDVELNRQLQECNDLSQSDYAVLVELNEAPEGRLRPVELGAVLAWEQSRLSHHLSRMVKRGLVVREECTSDRRGAYVVLTPAGKQAIDTAAPSHVARVRELLFDGLTDREAQSLASVMSKVLARLDDLQAGRQT